MTDSDAAPEPVGTPGVLIFAGSSFAISEFRLTVDDHGEMHASMQPQLGWEMWPLWMRVAIEHEGAARTARRALLSAPDDVGRAAALADVATG